MAEGFRLLWGKKYHFNENGTVTYKVSSGKNEIRTTLHRILNSHMDVVGFKCDYSIVFNKFLVLLLLVTRSVGLAAHVFLLLLPKSNNNKNWLQSEFVLTLNKTMKTN